MTDRLYRTETTLERTLRVAYPAGHGQIVLRTEQDWERDIPPLAVSDDGQISTFRLQADQPFLYVKPCLIQNGRHLWSVGANKLLLMGEDDQRLMYPFFLSPEHGQFSPLIEFPSRILGRAHQLRVYVPPATTRTRSRRSPSRSCRTARISFSRRTRSSAGTGRWMTPAARCAR